MRHRWGQGQNPRQNQGFTYVNDATTSGEGSGIASAANSQTMSLSQVQPGERVRVVRVDCGEANPRLVGMGITQGAVLTVLSHLDSGSVLVECQGQRWGLGAGMAERIGVERWEAAMPRMTLGEATIGSRVRVVGYAPGAGDYKRKLLGMGLTPGTILQVKRHAPLGDPTEIEVRGFALSLRKGEAAALQVVPVEGEANLGSDGQ
ncbi:ferrous iron transport protein A [Thermostichus sp. MS-CIW-40]